MSKLEELLQGGELVLILSLAFSSGLLWARVAALEAWRAEWRADLAAIRTRIDEVRRLVELAAAAGRPPAPRDS